MLAVLRIKYVTVPKLKFSHYCPVYATIPTSYLRVMQKATKNDAVRQLTVLLDGLQP